MLVELVLVVLVAVLCLVAVALVEEAMPLHPLQVSPFAPWVQEVFQSQKFLV
jgi:hypothetical protein